MTTSGGSTLPLAERLRPTRLADLVGNSRARSELRAWADRWQQGTPPSRRAVILSGPPGVGKTTAAVALASDLGWTLVEMNASDARNQSAIERVAGRASVSQTLDGARAPGGPGRALILLDEADCLTGRLTEPSRTVVEPPPLRDFLRGRYGTIDALNAAWGLGPTSKSKSFVDWTAVPRSPGNFAWGRLPAARRDLDDWRASGRPVDTTDRGGLGAIARLVRSTLQPLVLTVNDDRTLNRNSAVFRSAAQRIRFYPIRPDEMAARLDRIVRDLHLAVVPEAVSAIVGRARGDLRAALNDLDAVSFLPPGPAQLGILGARDRTDDFAGLTAEALSVARLYRSGEVRDRLDAPPDDLLPWIEENIVHFAPDARHRDAAFATLARAERLLMRAGRTRTWGLWSYASELLTGGVGLAIRDRAVPVSGEAMFPAFLGEMGRSRGMREVRGTLSAKIGERLHLSREKVREGLLPDLEGLARPIPGRPPSERAVAFRRAIVRELELSPEETAFLFDVPVEDLPPEPSTGDDADGPGDLGPPSIGTVGAPPPEPVPRKRAQRSLSEF